jgi:Uma2 family endonuclease
MIAEQVRQMTVAEYLAFEEDSDIKNEYIDGEIYPMTGGTLHHSAITVNLILALGIRLEGADCRVLSSDMRVRVAPTRFVYPDLSVVCGEPQTEYNALTLLNPTLVVEVTSPSSIEYDRAMKREYYEAIESLEVYLVIDQHRVFVELFTRTELGWHLQYFSNLDDVAPLEALGCSLPMAEVYRGITIEEVAP